MNINEYKEHVKALEGLEKKAKKIGHRLFPDHHYILIDAFDSAVVSFEANSQHFDDAHKSAFPAEWLFSDDWEALVDALLAEKQAEVERKAAERKADIERRERAMLEELQERYSIT